MLDCLSLAFLVALLRDSYRKLANELIAQVKLVDNLEAEPEPPAAAAQLHWLYTEHQKCGRGS
jgi:hypothetical protein